LESSETSGPKAGFLIEITQGDRHFKAGAEALRGKIVLKSLPQGEIGSGRELKNLSTKIHSNNDGTVVQAMGGNPLGHLVSRRSIISYGANIFLSVYRELRRVPGPGPA